MLKRVNTECILPEDELRDFEVRTFTFDECSRRVYLQGTGPGVIVLSEMPGISPELARFARWTSQAGYSVYVPSLFGKDGAVVSTSEALDIFKSTCISREFQALAAGEDRPVVRWLRQLAKQVRLETVGPGVGVIGMCFTGNFAISLMIEQDVRVAVACHPSLPLDSPDEIDLTPQETVGIRQRIEAEGLGILGVRFDNDRWCTKARFEKLRTSLGDGFEMLEVPGTGANPVAPPFFQDIVGCPHGVVTAHLVDQAGSPTLKARDEIHAFLGKYLLPKAIAPACR